MAEAFPNATTIRAGTFDDYFEQLQAPAVRSKLPVVTAGVEDTWLYGCGASHTSFLSLAPLHAKNGRSNALLSTAAVDLQAAIRSRCRR